MSAVFFEEMDIPKPDYNLNINGLGHGAMTGQMLERIEEILLQEKPDWVLVYGDTNSTLAGALTAKKLHIKVALPLHPRTKMKLQALNYDFENSKICFISPVGYLEMIYLLKSCELVICDSGGLQKESYFFSKYCIFIYETETPWKELKENGFLFQTYPAKEKIISLTRQVLLKNKTGFEKRLYGLGDAGEKILEELLAQN